MGQSIYLTDRQIKAFKNAVSQYSVLANSPDCCNNEHIQRDYDELVAVEIKLIRKQNSEESIKKALEICKKRMQR